MKTIIVNRVDQRIQEIAPHEILLSFNDDIGAEAFDEWWLVKGKQQFEEFCAGEPRWRSALVDVEDYGGHT